MCHYEYIWNDFLRYIIVGFSWLPVCHHKGAIVTHVRRNGQTGYDVLIGVAIEGWFLIFIFLKQV